MNSIVIFSLLIFLGIFTLVLVKQDKTTKNNPTEYFLCGRHAGFLSLTLTFLATQLGGGVILGCSEAAYFYGWSALYYAIGLSSGLFILSLGIGARFRNMEISTIPEIFTRFYHSPLLRMFGALILICSMSLILLALGVATRKVFFALGFTNEWLFIVFWLVVILYTSLGGLSAVIKTDIVQILFVLAMFLVTFFAIASNQSIDLSHLWSFSIEHGNTTMLPWTNWLLMPMLFAIIGQDMGQRCFAARSPLCVSFATFFASILLILSSLFPVFLGIIARQYDLPIKNASVLIQLVSQLTTPLISALFSGAILMAILSTADSLLCAISLNITCDLFKGVDKTKQAFLGKVITLIVGTLAMACSFLAIDIIPIMIVGYELSLVALLIPILMAVFSNKPHAYAAWAACLTGLIFFTAFKFLPIDFEKALAAILLSLLSYILIRSLLHDVVCASSD